MGLFGKSNRPNIEKLKKERDVEGLIGALRDKDSDVRNAAIEALSNVNDPRVSEEINRCADGRGRAGTPLRRRGSRRQPRSACQGAADRCAEGRGRDGTLLRHPGPWEPRRRRPGRARFGGADPLR